MRVRDFISVVSANMHEVELYNIDDDLMLVATICELKHEIPEVLDATIQDIDTFVKRGGKAQFLISTDFDGTI